VPARYVRDNRARNQRLFNNARLVVRREPATSAGPRDHFQPANRGALRLKRMVKRRHKPISHSDEEISSLNPRKPHKQGGATTPLTLHPIETFNRITAEGQRHNRIRGLTSTCVRNHSYVVFISYEVGAHIIHSRHAQVKQVVLMTGSSLRQKKAPEQKPWGRSRHGGMKFRSRPCSSYHQNNEPKR
jgi:hypothetical protein